MAAIALDTVVKKNEDIFTGNIDNETVAMSVQNGKYYQLNETGSRIFALLEAPHSVKELIEALEGQFKVDGSTCRQDVLEFLQEMLEYKLITLE
jgi:hypothetical protein